MPDRSPVAPSAVPSSPAPRRGRRLGFRAARLAASVLLAITVVAGVAGVAGVAALAEDADPARGGTSPPKPTHHYAAFEKAWKARNPNGVVALVAPRGALRLQLQVVDVRGSYQRAHALRTLLVYFRYVSAIHLKDVTKASRTQPRGWAVRQYDYTYAPRGRDRVTTRLIVTMRLYGRDSWMLDSIVEIARPSR